MPIEEALASRSVVIVAAHPDDETVGVGGLLPRLRNPVVVTVTDGAPRHPADAERAGCSSREDYARLRYDELLGALDVAGVPPCQTRALNIVDQEASLEMAYVTLHLVDILRELRPAAILTHPYEGGHPDHDATAFAVHAACARVPSPPDVFEFTSYHAQVGRRADRPEIEVGRFLPESDDGEPVILPADLRHLKSRMISCYASQLHMLQHFPLDIERYREAPAYDFTSAPHPGKLYYENFDWGVTGARWRHLAEEALRTLGAGAATL
jgi:LmbE family N-acetylglucosaminyl deacetylase